MKNIQIALLSLLLGITALWFWADTLFHSTSDLFAIRGSLFQYSGVIAMSAMSVCMILAVRFQIIEKALNGLDKAYRLHKWLGIVAVVATLVHYYVPDILKDLAKSRGLARPARPKMEADGLHAFFNQFRHLAEEVGEWAFYGAIVLMIVALIKRIPYRWFEKFHFLLAVAYLALVFHSVILLKWAYWQMPIGWLMAILMAWGSVSAILVLLKCVGKKRQFWGVVEQVTVLPKMKSVQLSLSVPTWRGHKAGQFVFLKHSQDKESPHPFTLSSSWDEKNPVLTLIIKQLGDYTAQCERHFQVGDKVRVEGAYGAFTFQDNAPQIWVAGGVGITPFMARLQTLAKQGGAKQETHLFYSFRQADDVFLNELTNLANQAKVALHLMPSVQGRLDGAKVAQTVAQKQASIWFCGGNAFAKTLKADLRKQGFLGHWHQELFEMR